MYIVQKTVSRVFVSEDEETKSDECNIYIEGTDQEHNLFVPYMTIEI